MGRFFNYDSGFMTVLSKAADMVILSILWLIFSIPIITVGASTSALYYACNKAIRQNRGYAWQEFWRGFRMNFKQSTLSWLLVLLVYAVSFVDCYILKAMSEQSGFFGILQAIIIAVIIIMTMWVLYLFPYLARFENPTKVCMKNAILIMIANAPWSLLLTILFVVSAALFLIFPIVSIFIPAVYMWIANKILERVFRKYMTPEDLEAEKELDMMR